MPDLLKCQITTSLIEFHIVLKRNIKNPSQILGLFYIQNLRESNKSKILHVGESLRQRTPQASNPWDLSSKIYLLHMFIHFIVKTSRGSKPSKENPKYIQRNRRPER